MTQIIKAEMSFRNQESSFSFHRRALKLRKVKQFANRQRASSWQTQEESLGLHTTSPELTLLLREQEEAKWNLGCQG